MAANRGIESAHERLDAAVVGDGWLTNALLDRREQECASPVTRRCDCR